MNRGFTSRESAAERDRRKIRQPGERSWGKALRACEVTA